MLATGPVEAGTLQGDLVLVGGGDPVLDTDRLGELAAAVRAAGIDRVAGRFLVADGALPFVEEVAADQPEDAGYNPTVSGMNLNFNRVLLTWAPGQPLSFGAPGTPPLVVPVAGIGGAVGDGPIRHRIADGREMWSLPAARVAGSGTDWLPVRAPSPYAGEVFGWLAGQAGLALPPAIVVRQAEGMRIASSDSPPLDRMLHDMLRYSTNLTAEAVGLSASEARGVAPDGIAASAAAMSGWARTRFGLPDVALVDHSGLGATSRVAPAEMVSVLRQADGLAGMLGCGRSKARTAAARSRGQRGGEDRDAVLRLRPRRLHDREPAPRLRDLHHRLRPAGRHPSRGPRRAAGVRPPGRPAPGRRSRRCSAAGRRFTPPERSAGRRVRWTGPGGGD